MSPSLGAWHADFAEIRSTTFWFGPFRTIESLYEELVAEGIIIRHDNKISLANFEGEYSYLGTTLRQANFEPMPSLSDVRRLVTEYAILPLGMLYRGIKTNKTDILFLFYARFWSLS